MTDKPNINLERGQTATPATYKTDLLRGRRVTSWLLLLCCTFGVIVFASIVVTAVAS